MVIPSIRNSTDPIVMVDDSKDDVYIAKYCYKKSALKNPFVTVTSGDEFLEYMNAVMRAEQSMPAVILLDINMPGLDGFDVLTEIRACDEFTEVPVIMLTNSDDPSDISRAQSLGADEFQTKPMQFQDYTAFFDSLQ